MNLNGLIYISLGCLIILCFDAFGAILSRKFKFNYTLLSIGSIIIYGGVAIITAEATNTNMGVIGAIFPGFIDATLGIIVAKKLKAFINKSNNFNWEIEPRIVFIMIIISGLIGYLSIKII